MLSEGRDHPVMIEQSGLIVSSMGAPVAVMLGLKLLGVALAGSLLERPGASDASVLPSGRAIPVDITF